MLTSSLVNYFHSGVSGYIVLGWMLNDIIHSKILLLFIPSIYVNWLIDNNRCLLTRLENYYIKKELSNSKKVQNDDGFIKNKLKNMNIEISDENIHILSVLVIFHTFIQSYVNIIYI